MSSSFSSLKKSTQESSSLASSINRNQEDVRSTSETIKTKIDRLTLGFDFYFLNKISLIELKIIFIFLENSEKLLQNLSTTNI
jgi:hypothetical protein